MPAAPNTLARAWRSISSWFEPRWWLGSPGPVNPPCDLTGYLEGDASLALSLPAVLRGVAIYSDTLSTLPRRVVRRMPDEGLEIDDTSDGANALTNMSDFDLEGAVAAAIIGGNGYLEVGSNSRGGASELTWLPSTRVNPVLDDNGRLFYRIGADTTIGERERVLPAGSVVHLKYRAAGSSSRYLGTSPLATCWPSIATAITAREFQREIFRNVSTPSTVLTAPMKISKELADRIRTDWQQNFGPGGRGRTAVLGEGLTVAPVTVATAVDSQLSDQFSFGVDEVARCLGVPPALLARASTLTAGTADAEIRAFAALSLGPLASRFAGELTRKILTRLQQDQGWKTEFDLRSLLVSPSEQPDRLSKLVNGGVCSPNEARELLGLADIPGGDALRCPVNTQPLERWLAGASQQQQPAHDQVPANPQPESAGTRALRAI